MKVPFLDLNAHHAPLRPKLSAAIEEVIDSGDFAGGPFVKRFEEEFARYCGVAHAVGVSSGTDALWLALLALGIGPGDEVVTVPMTFIATAEAISRTGARPVFVDIDQTTYTMDPSRLVEVLTSRTKAIIPVHLFGQLADMDSIRSIAKKYAIPVIEDAAQAHGARDGGRRAGSFGDLGCFSFYPGKNLGAFGEAGMVVTENYELASRIQVLRDHGQMPKYHHATSGWNCRMDGIQAAVLSVKLPGLDRNNELRKQHAIKYTEALNGIANLILPAFGISENHVHHLYVVRVPDRTEFMQNLKRSGIESAIHYPLPIHLQGAYSNHDLDRGSFPASERCADEFVSLPIYPELTCAQTSAVINAVAEAKGVALYA